MPTIVIKVDPKNPDQKDLDTAVSYLKQGRIVAIPTETVYGLAANFSNKDALEKLYKIKNRPQDKPFTLAISKKEIIQDFVLELSPLSYKLMNRFWPGPLTLIFKAKDGNTIGFRLPKNKIALNILDRLNLPLALPSANISGEEPACIGKDVLRDLDGKVDLIIDAGKVELCKPSTIVDLSERIPKVVRVGAIKKEILEKIFREKNILFVCTGNTCRSVMAMGLLKKEIAKRADILIDSAGIYAFDGQEASFEAKELLKNEGIDLSDYHAKSVNPNMIREADLILVMTSAHKQQLLLEYPFIKNRLYLLKEFAKITESPLDITDPVGQGSDVYKRVFIEIKQAVKNMVDLI